MGSSHRGVYISVLAPAYSFQRGPNCGHRGSSGVSADTVNGNASRICSEYFSYPCQWLNYFVFFHYSFICVVNNVCAVNITECEAHIRYIKMPKGNLDQLEIIFLKCIYLFRHNCSGILHELAFPVLLPQSFLRCKGIL